MSIEELEYQSHCNDEEVQALRKVNLQIHGVMEQKQHEARALALMQRAKDFPAKQGPDVEHPEVKRLLEGGK